LFRPAPLTSFYPGFRVINCGNSVRSSDHDIDPVAINLLAFDHHIAKIHPDAELHPAWRRQIRIRGPERGLNIDRTINCDHARKFGENTVAGGVDETTAMLLDGRTDDFAMGSKGAQRRLFVLTRQAAIALNVGAEYRCELAFHSITRPR
jgi:hypothetical protein